MFGFEFSLVLAVRVNMYGRRFDAPIPSEVDEENQHYGIGYTDFNKLKHIIRRAAHYQKGGRLTEASFTLPKWKSKMHPKP